MEQVTDRELLWELAQKPIGAPELQAEAEKLAHMDDKSAASPELREAGNRANKKWLPAGKRSASGPEERAKREAFFEKQIDIEEAIEAAGGHRGSART